MVLDDDNAFEKTILKLRRGGYGLIDLQRRDIAFTSVWYRKGKALFGRADVAMLLAANFLFDFDPVTVNTNTITLHDGSMMPFGGTIENSGTIALESQGDQTLLEILFRGATLTGGDALDVSDLLSDSGYTGDTSTNPLKTPRRVHTIVQHADHGNPVIGDAEIDCVPPHPAAAIAFADVITGRAELRIVRELIEGGAELIGVTMGLLDSPFFECVPPDPFKIARCCRG